MDLSSLKVEGGKGTSLWLDQPGPETLFEVMDTASFELKMRGTIHLVISAQFREDQLKGWN